MGQRLLPLLIERFPDSSHVRPIGLGGASDCAIWEWAREQALLLVTKHEDFLDLSVARGFPPKVDGVPGDRQRQQRGDGGALAPASRDDRGICAAS
jgi:hypothetical protein